MRMIIDANTNMACRSDGLGVKLAILLHDLPENVTKTFIFVVGVV